MLKINSLLKVSQLQSHGYTKEETQLNELAKKAESFKLIQKYWVGAVDLLIAKTSFAGSIKNNQMTVFAQNAIVASKIKLISPQILKRLYFLQQSQPMFNECKVSAIVVKVQVKSSHKTALKTPRKVSNAAANNLKSLADTLGETPLAARLISLANKK